MNKKEDPCWSGYEMIGSKKKNGKKVPNCVPVKENKFPTFLKWLQESKSPAWQRSDGKNSRINKSLRAWDCNENHIDIAMGKQIDEEGSMVLNQLDMIEDAVKKLRSVIKSPDMQLPAWVQAKITLSTDYMQTTSYYMASKNE